MTNGASLPAIPAPAPRRLPGDLLARRTELEARIERHLSSFVEACQALLEIRDGLLGDDYASFDDYIARRWNNFSDRHGRRLRFGLGVLERLGPIGPEVNLRESHLREFGGLDPALYQPTWAAVVELAKTNKLTASLVRRVVRAAATVTVEAMQSQGHVTVGGETLALEAAITEEMQETSARQQQHIAEASRWEYRGQVVLVVTEASLTALQRGNMGEVADGDVARLVLYTRKQG